MKDEKFCHISIITKSLHFGDFIIVLMLGSPSWMSLETFLTQRLDSRDHFRILYIAKNNIKDFYRNCSQHKNLCVCGTSDTDLRVASLVPVIHRLFFPIYSR
ncbi:hypothetical protein D9M68_796510 [compost metagenome]